MNLSCIVCAIDSADTSPAVLASAMTLAAWDAAELHVVYLADPTSEPASRIPSVVGSKHETTIVSGDPVTAVVDRARRVRADLIVIGATLADAHIVAEARRLGAHLIVMGLTSRGGAVPARVGSMVSRVAAQAASPVMVLRATAGSPGWDDLYNTSERRYATDPDELFAVPVGADQRRAPTEAR